MKKFLSLILCSLMFGVVLGNFNYIYAGENDNEVIDFNDPEDANPDNAGWVVTVTKGDVKKFKTEKADIINKIKDAENKRRKWKENLDKEVNNLAMSDKKYIRLKELYNEIPNKLFSGRQNQKEVLNMIDEAIAIKDMDIFHFQKAIVMDGFVNEKEILSELNKVKENVRPMMPFYYSLLANLKKEKDDFQGALDAITKGINTCPSKNDYMIRASIYRRMGDKGNYNKDRKTFLILLAIDEMGY